MSHENDSTALISLPVRTLDTANHRKFKIITPNSKKFIVGFAGSIVEAGMLSGIMSGYGDNQFESFKYSIIGGSIGYSLGCPIGVTIYGKHQDQKGSFFSSSLGMFLGVAASGVVGISLFGLGVDTDILAAITIPMSCITGPLGCVIGHNISSRRRGNNN
jgi:hypothetical protein